MIELSTHEHPRQRRGAPVGFRGARDWSRGARVWFRGAQACVVWAFALACGTGGEGNGGQEVPTPLLSQETGEAGDTSPVGSGELVAVRVGGVEIRVEIADDAAERERGLMHRESLPDDQGMLFVYATQATRSFWMRNTLIPLDIAFIDADGVIVDIQPMEQTQTEELTTSRYPAMYALEMNLGWFETNGVEVGDRLEF